MRHILRTVVTMRHGLRFTATSLPVVCCGATGEYKRNLGVEFGEYSLRQYRYAKDYYRIVQDELRKSGESGAQENA